MIKFFRKIRYNLMETGKTGKYFKYAIGEIILVVIGILIALSINNWNEEKKEQQDEYLALKSLYSEFVESRELFNQGQRHHEMIFDGMQYLLEILDAKRVNESMVDSIYWRLDRSAWSSGIFEPSRGIVNSLINSGKQNIIRNDSLKSLLIQWNDQVISFQNTERLAQDYKFTYLFPLISKLTQLPSKLKRSDPNQSDVSHGEVDLDLLQSKVFYNYLNQCWVYKLNILAEGKLTSKGQKVKEALDNIISLIEKELEK
ncbi:MAG: hypothetical protein DA407_13950 [Bacteroidetes bacterium]|nr:MAG: hypothetical protein DA407_13950 [Bacteroidota bacterium]